MNQRLKRSRKGKGGQDLSGAVINVGSHVAAHRRGETPQVRIQKATGDVKGENPGLAKASPFFKKLSEVVSPKSKAEEKKIVAGAIEKPKAAPKAKTPKEDEDSQ